jgi:hypothetical protein
VGDVQVVAVFTLDVEGRIESANNNFVLTMFGYTNAELVGKSIGMLIPSLSSTRAVATIGTSTDPAATGSNQSASGGGGGGVASLLASWNARGVRRVVVRHKDGSTFPVDLEIAKFNTAEACFVSLAH